MNFVRIAAVASHALLLLSIQSIAQTVGWKWAAKPQTTIEFFPNEGLDIATDKVGNAYATGYFVDDSTAARSIGISTRRSLTVLRLISLLPHRVALTRSMSPKHMAVQFTLKRTSS